MGKLWNIIEEWRDGMAFPPSYRQIAIRLGVSQSSFDTWKAPTEMPKKHNLLAISRLTGVPYRMVVDAAVEDTKLYDEASAELPPKAKIETEKTHKDVRESRAVSVKKLDKPAKVTQRRGPEGGS